ncbi:MAG: hypothetical protein QG670_2686, partial [Thermoproteota archaeon]|nr:hypothetical protein [Thermoproteota archaeon]
RNLYIEDSYCEFGLMMVIWVISKHLKVFKTILERIRLSSILNFSLTTCIGATLSEGIFNYKIISLLIFAGFSTTFGFLLNDFTDRELDKSAGKMRNLFSTGTLQINRGIIIISCLFLVSTASLSSLNPMNKLLGLILLFLYFTYSWIIRAKTRPILDILYHGSCPAILITMGYIENKPDNFAGILLALLVFSLSSISEILQETRDYESDSKKFKTTVIMLGKKNSMILCSILFTFATIISFSLLLWRIIPLETILLSPIVYFYIVPIFKSVTNGKYEKRSVIRLKKGILPLIILLITIIVIKECE